LSRPGKEGRRGSSEVIEGDKAKERRPYLIQMNLQESQKKGSFHFIVGWKKWLGGRKGVDLQRREKEGRFFFMGGEVWKATVIRPLPNARDQKKLEHIFAGLKEKRGKKKKAEYPSRNQRIV